MRYRKEVDPAGRRGGEDLGRTEERETVIRIYYVRKKSILNKRGSRGYTFMFLGLLRPVNKNMLVKAYSSSLTGSVNETFKCTALLSVQLVKE